MLDPQLSMVSRLYVDVRRGPFRTTQDYLTNLLDAIRGELDTLYRMLKADEIVDADLYNEDKVAYKVELNWRFPSCCDQT